MKKNVTDIFRTKAKLSFALSLISQEREKIHPPSNYPALKTTILIRNDSLTSEVSEAKNRYM